MLEKSEGSRDVQGIKIVSKWASPAEILLIYWARGTPAWIPVPRSFIAPPPIL